MERDALYNKVNVDKIKGHHQKSFKFHLLKVALSIIPRFYVEGLPKSLEFGYFALIWWQTDKKQEILKQSCKDQFIWTELPIV